MEETKEVTREYFRATDQIPEEVWYWAALGSILISAFLRIRQNPNWAIFVGQWPPTFLLFGLYHRLLKVGK
ncbi:MAG TPA: hypothetical protein VM409_05805 [Chloroflexia bacterium]|nr:hypothetical protein [Chloroflexia bacterium]